MQRLFNSPRILKSGETIGLGSVNLSGNWWGEILIFSSFPWSTVSFPYSTFVSVIFVCLGFVEVPDSNCGGIVFFDGEIICHDLSLSSLHLFCSVSGFRISTIWISWTGLLLGLGLGWAGNWGHVIGWGLCWIGYGAGNVGWFWTPVPICRLVIPRGRC